MNINTPFFQIYGRALTGTSLIGFASIGIEKFVLNELKNKKSYHILSALKQICEFAAAVKIMQAACLALGQVNLGLLDSRSVILIVPLTLKIMVVNSSQFPESFRSIIKKIDENMSKICFVACFISALVIISVFGLSGPLWLEMGMTLISSSTYLIYNSEISPNQSLAVNS